MSTAQTPNWQSKLPACFGQMDLKFASHQKDEGRAKAMMREAFMSGASIEEVETAIRDYLLSKGTGEEHIQEQIQFARKLKLS